MKLIHEVISVIQTAFALLGGMRPETFRPDHATRRDADHCPAR